MTSKIANLEMYNLNEIQIFNDTWWSQIQMHCANFDLNPPIVLKKTFQLQDEGSSGNLFLGQTCGWPLTINQDAYKIIGIPKYACSGCMEEQYRSVIIKRKDLYTDSSFKQLKNRIVAVNSRTSCSGCLMLAATVGKDIMKSAKIKYTGAHVKSIEAVSSGCADFASIDCVTFALLEKHRPDLLLNIKVIGFTFPCPSLPYVTSKHATSEFICNLQASIQRALDSTEPTAIHARSQLLIRGMKFPQDPNAAMGEYVARISRLQQLALSASREEGNFITDLSGGTSDMDMEPNPLPDQGPRIEPAITVGEAEVFLRSMQQEDCVFAQSLLDHIFRTVHNTDAAASASHDVAVGQGSQMYSSWGLMEDGIRCIRTIFPEGISAAAQYLGADPPDSSPVYDIVCFLGNRKGVHECLSNDHEIVSDCWATDAQLCLNLDGNVVLGYATAEVEPGGDWGNVVLFKRGKSADDFVGDNTTHCRATRDISPLYYDRVRIHRGKAVLSTHQVTILRTLFAKYNNPNDGDTCPIQLRKIFEW